MHYKTSLNIFPPTVRAAICSNTSYLLPDGKTASTAGVYISHISSPTACDRVAVTRLTSHAAYLKLTVLPRRQVQIDTTICKGQSFEGYSEAGVYVDHFQSAGGCDSTRTIRLQIVLLPDP